MTTKTLQPLKTLISCRIRLDEDQRATLRGAYNKIKADSTPAVHPNVMPGSTIKVGTNYSVNTALGLADITISDILNSRDSIALGVLLKLQQALGVEVITQKDVLDAAASYVAYCWESADAS